MLNFALFYFFYIINNIMDKIKEIVYLISINKYRNGSSDIMEHIYTLYNYAKECDTVFETGVRGCISSWAFLYGLLDNNNGNKKRLFMNDIQICDIDDLLKIGQNFEIDIKYEWKNNLDLEIYENYDITFIDTWHVYGQLKRELEKFSKITNKYIIMHDTTVDEKDGESIRCSHDIINQSKITGFPINEITKGLGPAIEEFLEINKEWYIKEKYINNNGLTVLAKR
jgi:hypothetical protein